MIRQHRISLGEITGHPDNEDVRGVCDGVLEIWMVNG
jgi:hypothetical protein